MERQRLWMMWWSGLFAAATFVHLLRVALGLDVAIGALHVPMWLSWVIFPLAGAVSLGLVRKARGIG
jgi:hypothetical protein